MVDITFEKPYLVIVNAVLAQLVEQRTENPCVPGSIPGDGTRRTSEFQESFFIPQIRGIIPRILRLESK